jgi:hypothetical protein
MYVFNETIQTQLYKVLVNNITVTPLEPPYIQVTKGIHTSKQKLGKFLSGWVDTKVIKETVEHYKEINGDLSQYVVTYSKEYVEVYQTPLYAINSTAKSCMTNCDSVQVYGYDERLSLLLVHTNEDVLIGRTLVRNDTMNFVRIYLDHNKIKPFMMNAIVAREGYTQGSLEGIELELIEEDNNFVMPYIDGENSFDVTGDCITITRNGEFDACTTNGYVGRERTVQCDCCGSEVPEEDVCYINECNVCEHCVDANYIMYEGDWYHNEDCITNLSNNEVTPLVCIDNEDVSCTDDGDWYNSGEVVSVSDCNVHISECKKLVSPDENDNYYMWESDVIEIEDIEDMQDGFYTTAQVETALKEKQETLASLQADLFEDFEPAELIEEELNTLINNITTLEGLL